MAKFGRFNLFPLIALKYFAFSLAILFAVALMIDRVVLPSMVKSGVMNSFGWVLEDEKYVEYMYSRNLADRANPVWRSVAWPVSSVKPKKHRILVIGDSFIWGHGYTNMNTIWWRQLARELQRRGYDDVEIIAAGMSDTGTRGELDWAKKLVPEFKPDLVIIGYVTNDADEFSKSTGKRLTNDPYLIGDVKEKPSAFSKLFADIFPNLSQNLFWIHRNIVGTKLLTGGKVYGVPGWELELLKGKNFEQYKETVSDLAQFARTSKIPVFVIGEPLNYAGDATASNEPFLDGVRSYYGTRYAPVKKVFQDSGVRFEDDIDRFINAIKSDPAFVARHDQGIDPVNKHPSAPATHAYATITADILEKDYPQSLGDKQAKVSDRSASFNINDWVPPSVVLRKLSPSRFEIVLTHSADDLLQMRLNKPYLQLNFENPVAIGALTLSGDSLVSADVLLTREDAKKHYDDDSLLDLGRKQGKLLEWGLTDKTFASSVNSILICPEIKGLSRRLILEIHADRPVK